VNTWHDCLHSLQHSFFKHLFNVCILWPSNIHTNVPVGAYFIYLSHSTHVCPSLTLWRYWEFVIIWKGYVWRLQFQISIKNILAIYFYLFPSTPGTHDRYFFLHILFHLTLWVLKQCDSATYFYIHVVQPKRSEFIKNHHQRHRKWKGKMCFSKQFKWFLFLRIRGHRTWRRDFPTVDS